MGAIDTIINALRVTLPNFARSDGEIESKMIDVVGTYADTEALERQNSLNVINDALANQRITTKEYYRRKAVEFQIGDPLVYDPINQGGYYAIVRPENRIIKQAYITGSTPDFILLVNAIGADGHLRALTTSELQSFTTYFDAFQPLGLELTIQSYDVAKISDPGLIIYVRSGADAQDVVTRINNALLTHEATLRLNNAVSLSEIGDIFQSVDDVRAVGFGSPVATEVGLDGQTRTVFPIDGIFNLTNGAFTFSTEITTERIKVIQ